MSPLGIRIMLHHHYSYAEWPEPSPAATELFDYFVAEEMLFRRGSPPYPTAHVISERGEAFVEFLQSVPLPTSKWEVVIK